MNFVLLYAALVLCALLVFLVVSVVARMRKRSRENILKDIK